jgi:hypothetical protein
MPLIDHSLTEDQLAALVGPRTREVVQAFILNGPMSVPQLQKVLQLPSKTIYYQVGKLVKVGLLVLSSEDGTYHAIATNLIMPSGYQGARYEKLAAKSVGAGLRATIRRFEEAAERAPTKPDLVDSLLYLTGSLRLTAEKQTEFHSELRRLFDTYSNGDGNPVAVVFVQTPQLNSIDD